MEVLFQIAVSHFITIIGQKQDIMYPYNCFAMTIYQSFGTSVSTFLYTQKQGPKEVGVTA